ncbi:putative o-methyltransferase protein [Botrytis fragariae]|uniref:Putative o-methyltransferase protein n=1 Tax=Botrytis fragariae TaxID=1964551 RepID=A0A8H6EPH3_9HELO|nr:putative o-methyltransferase protein [Botrytis fragariae]KAF5879659.1 putative o-methyltransferase protein [Botrytis fragariae]
MTSLSPESLLSALKTFTSNPPASLLENHVLRTKLQTPADALARVLLSQYVKPVESVCIRIAWDLNLFPLLSTGEKSLEELAQFTEADIVLLARLLRSLAAFGVVKENGKYYTLSLSYTLFADSTSKEEVLPTSTRRESSFAVPHSAEFLGPAYLALPGFLADTNYKNPTDPQNTAVQTAFIWDFWRETRDGAGICNADEYLSGGNFAGAGSFPDSSSYVSGAGGPVCGADRNKGIEYVVHDIFTEQPVKVLYDFTDGKCVVILTQLRTAMKSGYSKLFIYEQIIPRSGASAWAVTQDFNMMTLLGAAERMRDCFVNVLSGTGLKFLESYPALDGVSEGLVEIEVE